MGRSGIIAEQPAVHEELFCISEEDNCLPDPPERVPFTGIWTDDVEDEGSSFPPWSLECGSVAVEVRAASPPECLKLLYCVFNYSVGRAVSCICLRWSSRVLIGRDDRFQSIGLDPPGGERCENRGQNSWSFALGGEDSENILSLILGKRPNEFLRQRAG